MRSTWFNRAAGRALLLALLTAIIDVPAAAAKPVQPRRSRAANLFAAAGLLLDVNRQVCGLSNTGQVCVAFAGSPVGGGGFWPKGTPDQYTFQSGIQLAGVIPNIPGFAWSGDTVGAFFVDTRGTQEQGDGLTLIYNSLNAQDVAQWPNGGIIRDTALFSSVLIGRKSASQGDSWVREWEGDPSFLSGRTHPMGVAIDQRSLAWNYPSGNEDIIYFIFTFYNITARASSGKYNNPTLDPALQAEIGAVGDRFQDLNEQKFPGLQIPDTGYTITSMYSAFTMDADVANFNANYSTAVLPFSMGLTYTGDFLPIQGWLFPPDIFGAPFYPAPGFIGVKYLRSPESSPGNQVGLTMFSTFVNAPTGFPDPVGVRQLDRYLSGFLGATDNPCNSSPDPAVARALKLCFLAQFQADARFFQASGPFNLPPGESRTIVVAYVQAAPLEQPLFAIPGGGPGGDNPPGIPATGDSIFVDGSKVRGIERVMGWVSQADTGGGCNVARVNGKCPVGQGRPDSIIQQFEVNTAPRSLLNKALVAQAVFDNKFLLPFAPEAPPFFLVPGNNQVTVVWQKSVSEATGDPYFQVASNVTSPLYDPNFRQFDVEGYRVYRGRTAGQLELIAQFDYDGTSLIDYTGGFDYGTACAPELGINATPGCPVVFGSAPPFTTSVAHELTGKVVQVPPGGRVELASGDIFILKADTAVSGGPPACAGVACPELANTGVPFAFVDTDVRNSFTYHYTVTAFDANSVVSGPSALESPRITKPVIPRNSSPAERVAVLSSGLFGDDNVELNPNAPFSIDGATGKFTSRPAPTNALVGAFAPLVPQLLPQLSLVARIDSLRVRTDGDGGCPVSNGLGACYLIHLTFTKDGVPQQFTINLPWPVWDAFDGVTNIVASLGAVPIAADSVSVARFGVPQGFSQFNATVTAVLREYIRFSSFEGQAARRGLIAGSANANYSPGGSRWFNDSVETTDHPGLGIRVGHLAGTDTVWAPIHHTDFDPATPGVQSYANSGELQCFGYGFGGLMRHADVRFTWGAGGTIQTVRDVTHHVNVPFKAGYQSSYGFVGDFNGNGYIDVRDFNYVDIASQFMDNAGPLQFCNHTDPGPGLRSALLAQPVMMPVSVEAAPTAGTGTGFGLYVNGERYIVRLTGGTPPAAGAIWTLRAYAGTVRSSTATIQTANPAGYTYAATDRPPIIPGLEVRFVVNQPTQLVALEDSMLNRIHTVPDPYYVTNALEFTQNTKVLNFVNMPSRAIVRIYSVSGVLVRVLTQDDPTGGGQLTWNLRNRNNQFVASGVYFYHVETPEGKSKVGRFTVVNFAP